MEFVTQGFPLEIADARIVIAPEALAAAIGRLAGAGGDPAALDANYVRRSDAELLWKESV
jgi:hypothetical protein